MDRRELLKMIAVLTGGAVVGGEVFLTGCKNTESNLGGPAFSEADIPFLDEVADTILPATKTSPGAKEAKVGQFMTVIVNDCYEPDDQKTFHAGIKQLNDDFNKKYSTSFVNGSSEQKHDFLVALDKEAKEHQKKRAESMNGKDSKDKMPNHYFSLMKQLSLWGYFSSKEGMEKAMRYEPVPGHYDGCIDYKKGDKLYVGLGG